MRMRKYYSYSFAKEIIIGVVCAAVGAVVTVTVQSFLSSGTKAIETTFPEYTIYYGQKKLDNSTYNIDTEKKEIIIEPIPSSDSDDLLNATDAHTDKLLETPSLDGSPTDLFGQNEKSEIWLEEMNILQYGQTFRQFMKYELITTAQTDNTGERYAHGVIFQTANFGFDDVSHFLEYYLNNKYESISLTLALHEDSKSMNYCHAVSIFCDNEERLYKEIRAGYLPEEFVIDLTSVEKLKIQVTVLDYNSRINIMGTDKVIIGNAQLFKKAI